MRRDDYSERMEAIMRERAATVGPVTETDVPWGGFREERGETPAPTHDEWIARMRRAMYDTDALEGDSWTRLHV